MTQKISILVAAAILALQLSIAPVLASDGPVDAPVSISALPGDGRVSLSWRLAGDEPAWGFNVYRFPDNEAGLPERANLLPIPGGVQGRFDDDSLPNGSTVYYRVAGIDRDGREHWLPGGVFARPAPLPGDVDAQAGADGVCRVDGLDLVRVLAAFGKAAGEAGFDRSADLNGDGRIDGLDLEITARHFGDKRCFQDPTGGVR